MSLENFVLNTKKLMKNVVTRFIIPTTFTLTMFLSSCAPPDIPESTNSPTSPPTATPTHAPTPIPTPYIPDNVEVLPNNLAEKIIFYDENSITFSESSPELESLSIGDVIIFDKTFQTPRGFLAKVAGLNGNTIYTTKASFDEVIKDYSFNISNYSLDSSKATYLKLETGVIKNDSSTRGFSYTFDDVTFDLDGNDSTTNDQIHIRGSLNLDTNFNLGFSISDSLDYFFSQCEITDDLEITASALENLSDINESKKIAEYIFPDIYFTIPTPIPIPVVITPVASFYVGVNGNISPLSTTARQSATLTLGASYNDGQWTPIHDFNNEFFWEPPNFEGENNISVYAIGRVSVDLYHSLGTFAELKAGLKFESLIQGSNIDWKLFGELQGGVGVALDLFGNNLAEYSTNLFNYSKLLASGTQDVPPQIEKVLFASDRGGNFNIYQIDSNGSNLEQLTFETSNNWYPRWSVDRESILFCSDRNGNSDIFVMDKDGNNQTASVNTSEDEECPSWFANNEIVFSKDYEIWRKLGPGAYAQVVAGIELYDEPFCDPTSSDIICSGTLGARWEIYKRSEGQTNPLTISPNQSVNINPSYSLNGSKIVFCSDREQLGNYDIYSMNSDGTNIQRLTTNLNIDKQPLWSSDGRQIFFSSNRDGNYEIYSMNSDGTMQKRLTYNSAKDLISKIF